MIKKKLSGITLSPRASKTTKLIEEAAYYGWLDRERYAQKGDEFEDWTRAEKEVLGFSSKSDPNN